MFKETYETQIAVGENLREQNEFGWMHFDISLQSIAADVTQTASLNAQTNSFLEEKKVREGSICKEQRGAQFKSRPTMQPHIRQETTERGIRFEMR